MVLNDHDDLQLLSDKAFFSLSLHFQALPLEYGAYMTGRQYRLYERQTMPQSAIATPPHSQGQALNKHHLMRRLPPLEFFFLVTDGHTSNEMSPKQSIISLYLFVSLGHPSFHAAV